MAKHPSTILKLASLLCLLVLPVPTAAQTAPDQPSVKKPQAKATEKEKSEKETSKAVEVDDSAAQRRAFAISLVTSLADDARKYHDEALRPHVLARAADTLWDADNDTARSLFRRAWEAAEKGDAEELTLKTPDGLPATQAAMVTALRRISGHDLRADVLGLAARRDRALGEEFLNKLKEESKREAADSKNDSSARDVNDSWISSEAVSKRFQVANKLLDDGEIDRALEFAAPVLDKVNANSINFLSTLRVKRPEAADQSFAFLLARAEFDPSSDANTASGLSSYVFTPGLYVTFNVDGNTRWSQPEETFARPNLPAAIRNKFFQTAASILLRPLPPPDQDFTSSGRTGKYMVIKRLLPLFDQYAPDTASALRAQMTALAGDRSPKSIGDDTPLLKQGLQLEETNDDAGGDLAKLQYSLDHARTTRERDGICADNAVALADRGDARARDLADKIDDSVRRAEVRRYVDSALVQLAIRKKEALEAARLARAGQLTHTQRAWAYTQAARLLINSCGVAGAAAQSPRPSSSAGVPNPVECRQRPRALEFLEEAAAEARRIDADDRDRAWSLVGVATQFVITDRVRAWEVMDEAVKAANSAEKFTGENVQLHFQMMTKNGLKLTSIGGEDFGLSGVLRSLTKDDLYRSIDLAKSFKNDAPRATATLAIASALLAK